MSTTAPNVGKTRVFDTPDGEVARVELIADADYAAQLDLHLNGRHWQYGITAGGDVERIQVFENGRRLGDVDDPDWLEDALEMFDIPGGLV